MKVKATTDIVDPIAKNEGRYIIAIINSNKRDDGMLLNLSFTNGLFSSIKKKTP